MTAERRTHFVGIGGIGMSGIARLLLAKGVAVSGSDSRESAQTLELRALGAEVFVGHHPENVHGAGEVIVSSAIRPDNSELVEAARLGLPVVRRAQKLAALFNSSRGITIAGTHGKTTTSSMSATLLTTVGLDPSYVVGGIMNTSDDNGRFGHGEWFVIEADESDGTLVEYRPEIAVLTNVELDHMDFYRDMTHLDQVFATHLGHVKPGGMVAYCTDDAGAVRLLGGLPADVNRIGYGVTHGLAADLVASNITFAHLGSSFDVAFRGKALGRFELRVPGLHNVQNSLAGVAIGLHLDLSPAQIAEGLAAFRGVQRRFQIVGRNASYTVVDDYAHHPSEIKATLSAARSGDAGKRIISVFQPHRYSRTQSLAEDFGASFGNADEVIIAPIYGAGEDPIPGVSSGLIVDSLRANSHPGVHQVDGLENIEAYVADMMRPDDLVITLGAGDIWKVARNLSARMTA